MNKKLLMILAIVIIVAGATSGWVFNFIKSQKYARDKELTAVQSSFDRQYGIDGITIMQMVSPKKVYAVSWKSKDGLSHVSWNIGGIWVMVYTAPESTAP